MKIALLASLVLSLFFLALGIALPLVRFETLYVFNRAPSLIEIVASLSESRDFALAGIVFMVSITFPLLKLAVIAASVLGAAPVSGRLQRALPHLARWSLMDVLLVALVIVAAKTGGFATAVSQPGLWFYAASAVLAVLSHQLHFRLTSPDGRAGRRAASFVVDGK